MPAGPLALALGAEWRREELQQQYSDNYINGNYVGGAGAIPPVADKDRTVYAGFMEFNIPIVKTVEANVALRYDHYSDFGSTTNPKATLRWQPTTDLLLRGSFGTGFRAPSLSDLWQPPLTTNTAGNYSDPLRCPFTASTLDCSLQYDIKQGGNPALKPEKSTNWTLGLVWSPSAALSASLDYFNIEIKDVITLYPELAAVTPFLSQPTSGFNAAGLGVQRRPVDPATPNLPGPIDFFGQPLFNLGKIQTSGIDLELKGRSPATPPAASASACQAPT
jgi:iron complex outermembrane receptor protein